MVTESAISDQRFSIAGPKLWNRIPVSLRNADSLNSFKKHFKTYGCIYFAKLFLDCK